ncbi:unnamed protein product [Malus baccata var. baccata]
MHESSTELVEGASMKNNTGITSLKQQYGGDHGSKGMVQLEVDGGELDLLDGMYDKPLSCFGCGIGWFSTKDLRIDACDRFLLGFAFPPLWYYATVLYFGNHLKDPRERPGLAASAIAVRNYADFFLNFFCLLMFGVDILFPLVLKTCTGAGFNLLGHRRGCSTRCFLLAVAAGVMSFQEKERISATNCWQIL